MFKFKATFKTANKLSLTGRITYIGKKRSSCTKNIARPPISNICNMKDRVSPHLQTDRE